MWRFFCGKIIYRNISVSRIKTRMTKRNILKNGSVGVKYYSSGRLLHESSPVSIHSIYNSVNYTSYENTLSTNTKQM